MIALRGFGRMAEGFEHLLAPPLPRRVSAQARWALAISVAALIASAFALGAALHH